MNKKSIIVLILMGFIGLMISIIYLDKNKNISLNKNLFKNESSLDKYDNFRFGYSISYPKSWKEGGIAVNGDGRELYKDEVGNEVVVYASNVAYNFLTQGNQIDREIIELNDGTQATLLKTKEEDKYYFKIIITTDSQQFVLSASGSEEFINRNEELFKKIGKTLNIEERAPDTNN